MSNTYQFDSIDLIEFRRWANLSPGARIQTMLHARQLAVGLIRGQMRRLYPELSASDLNVKVLEEIERRGKQSIPRF